MNTLVETESKLAKHSADNPSAPLALGPEDVVLVSGGGKGITFELVSELARVKHCKLALLGSSPLPADGGANQDELLRNLARLKQEGIAHVYVQADVTDLEAVRRAVTEAERQKAIALCQQSDQTAALACMKAFGTTDFRADVAKRHGDAADGPVASRDDGTIRARREVAVQKHSATRLTYEDYLLFPDDGLRHEIIKGEHC